MARKKQKTKRQLRSNQLFSIIFPLAILIAIGVMIFPILFPKGKSDSSCGCGEPKLDESGEFQKQEKAAIFNNQFASYPLAELTPALEAIKQKRGVVLGAPTGDRWIEIDLSDQKLYAHNGGSIDYVFLISSGKWAPTPTGEFQIWIKLKYTKMEGGRKENNTYYYLPNVPYTQYFYKGYGLHGTYWHNNFGQPMSHGCVNLAIPDAEKLFYWTSPVVPEGKSTVKPTPGSPGTRVVIHS